MTASSAVLEQAALSVAAYRRIKRWLTLTPCIPSRLSFNNDTELVFKADNFQKTGSFKFRGAMSKLTSLSTDVPAITASSGNHGLALATAAQITGHDLTVVLPETVAREKLSRIKALGVETILHSNDSGLAELYAQKLAKEQGKIYCSPYNDLCVDRRRWLDFRHRSSAQGVFSINPPCRCQCCKFCSIGYQYSGRL